MYREKDDIDGTADMNAFVEWLVKKFNSDALGQFAIRSDIDGEYDGEEGLEWSVTDDLSLELNRNSNQCGLLIRCL